MFTNWRWWSLYFAPLFPFGLLWSKIRFCAHQNSVIWLIYREKKRSFSSLLGDYLTYFMEAESLWTYSCAALSQTVSQDILDIDLQVGISMIMAYKIQGFEWTKEFGVTCVNIEFLACFGRNSRPLSYDIRLKWCCLLITPYPSIEDYSQNLYWFHFM